MLYCFLSPNIIPLCDYATFVSHLSGDETLTFEGDNVKVNNLLSKILSIKGFPKVRTGSGQTPHITISGDGWFYCDPKTWLGAQDLRHHRARVNHQTELIRRDIRVPFSPTSLSIKYPKWLQSELTPLQELAHSTSISDKENEAQERKWCKGYSNN